MFSNFKFIEIVAIDKKLTTNNEVFIELSKTPPEEWCQFFKKDQETIFSMDYRNGEIRGKHIIFTTPALNNMGEDFKNRLKKHVEKANVDYTFYEDDCAKQAMLKGRNKISEEEERNKKIDAINKGW